MASLHVIRDDIRCLYKAKNKIKKRTRAPFYEKKLPETINFFCMALKTLNHMYKALVRSHLDYGDIIYMFKNISHTPFRNDPP